MTPASQRQPEQGADCEVPDCQRPSRRGGYCWTHCKRLQRGAPLNRPIQERLSPYGRVVEAVLQFPNLDSEATGDADEREAKERLRKAIERYARHLFGKRGGQAFAAQLTPEDRKRLGKQLAEARQRRAQETVHREEKQAAVHMPARMGGKQASESVHQGRQTRRRVR